HEHPEHHEDERRDPLHRELRHRSARRADRARGCAWRDGARPERDRVAHGLPALPAAASNPSAPRRVGFGASGSRVWTVATTERPGLSDTSFSTSSGKVTRTATRWTTLVKLPV